MVDLRRRYPVKIVWAPYLENRHVPIIFDKHAKLSEVFTAYLFDCAKRKIAVDGLSASKISGYKTHIRKHVYGLNAFIQFLEDNHLDWKSVDDDWLVKFRDCEQQKVYNKKAARNELSSKRSTNIKLREVYKFYLWAQEEQFFISEHIGWPESNITSMLPMKRNSPVDFAKSPSLKSCLYPLCFKSVGENSRTRNTHYATDVELQKLRAYFYDNGEVYTSDRNVLIVDIIEAVGWRQRSVHSLLIDQFSDEKVDRQLRNNEGYFGVCPPSQKGGYQNTYEIPLQLAIRINRFIRKSRKELLAVRNKTERVAKNYLFIGFTTCKPLGGTEISRIISKGFERIGSEKGSGPHSIRRKFAKERASEIIAIRKEKGYSISPQDVVQDMMASLGHSSRGAQEAYTRGKIDMYNESSETDLRIQNIELKNKVAELQLELKKVSK